MKCQAFASIFTTTDGVSSVARRTIAMLPQSLSHAAEFGSADDARGARGRLSERDPELGCVAFGFHASEVGR